MKKNYVETGNLSRIAAFNANMKYDNFSTEISIARKQKKESNRRTLKLSKSQMEF